MIMREVRGADMKYEDVIQLWGRNMLRSRGYNVSDTESVYVSLGYEISGYCETCEYTVGIIEIRANGYHTTVEGYDFTRVLSELVALSAENADRITK
jgi:hypothetical protein